MNVSDEAVEAAARSAYEARPMKRASNGSYISWDGLNAFSAGWKFKEGALAKARAALEAAAPHIAAEAWDACEEAKYEIRLNESGDAWEPVKVNPHR